MKNILEKLKKIDGNKNIYISEKTVASKKTFSDFVKENKVVLKPKNNHETF